MSDSTSVVSIDGYSVSKNLLTDLTKLRPPYDEVPVAYDDFGQKLDGDWKLHAVSENSRTGYDGALFSTEIDGSPHYFVYHQGTNDIKDMPSIARLGNGKPPQQMPEACAFSKQAQELIARKHPGEDIPIVQVGYSLGGAIAILACEEGQPAIVFDSPGTEKILKAQGRDPEAIGKRTLEVVSPHPNFVNSHESHIGEVLVAGEKFWQTDKVSIDDFIRMSSQAHRIKNIGLALAGMDEFPTTPAKESGRPNEVWDALREYIDDYKGQNPTLGERTLETTADVMDKLSLDKALTQLVVSGADAIASRFSRKYAEGEGQDYPHSPINSDVEHVREPSLEKKKNISSEPERPQPPQQSTAIDEPAFTKRIEQERSQPQQVGIGKS